MTVEERLSKFLGQDPQIDPTSYVARGAIVIGDVRIGPRASIWHNCVLRGDINSIEIGEGSNIQDGTMVHLADNFGVKVGKHVTVGHAAMIHACTIGDECLIGMQATILDGAEIGEQSIIGAHSLVTNGTKIPPGSLAVGVPAKVIKQLSPEERAKIRTWAEKYEKVSAFHKAKFGNSAG
ncbi:MAG: gamma carbonic anhydrase family protein [Opitutaceae bacterium]|nr:gamma carbonic anhydrase family protein [Opitutaceae bacterium]